MPHGEALAELIRIEQACGRFYTFLAQHIAESHHEEALLGTELAGMAREEARHELLLSLLAEPAGRGVPG